MGQPTWDERYDGADYVYGTEPNDFLVSQFGNLPPGRVLCLAEGEGRNAVFLAEHGFAVTAVDQSVVGLAKAERLAAQRGVQIETIVADLADFSIAPRSWEGIVSIFAHTSPTVRRHVHRRGRSRPQARWSLPLGGISPGATGVQDRWATRRRDDDDAPSAAGRAAGTRLRVRPRVDP